MKVLMIEHKAAVINAIILMGLVVVLLMSLKVIPFCVGA